jgi:hypothetical protein
LRWGELAAQLGLIKPTTVPLKSSQPATAGSGAKSGPQSSDSINNHTSAGARDQTKALDEEPQRQGSTDA